MICRHIDMFVGRRKEWENLEPYANIKEVYVQAILMVVWVYVCFKFQIPESAWPIDGEIHKIKTCTHTYVYLQQIYTRAATWLCKFSPGRKFDLTFDHLFFSMMTVNFDSLDTLHFVHILVDFFPFEIFFHHPLLLRHPFR